MSTTQTSPEATAQYIQTIRNRVGPPIPLWLTITITIVFAALVIIVGTILFARRQKHEVVIDHGPAIPSSLTPVTLLSFLDRLKERLPAEKRDELATEMLSL